jgi:hypothetical protein
MTYHQIYYQEHKEKMRETNRQWLQMHPSYTAQYYQKNREEILKDKKYYYKNYYQEHKEKMRETNRQWLKDHPEYKREYAQKHKKEINERKRKYYQKHPEKHDKIKKWKKDNPEKIAKYSETWILNHPEKKEAQIEATKSISVLDAKCQLCGSTENLQRHHPDYSKPLEVWILCRPCHWKIHNIMRDNI